jgi:hypothetical protein
MTKNEMAKTIDAVEDVMSELESSTPETRALVSKWLRNLGEDIESFLREYAEELYDD